MSTRTPTVLAPASRLTLRRRQSETAPLAVAVSSGCASHQRATRWFRSVPARIRYGHQRRPAGHIVGICGGPHASKAGTTCARLIICPRSSQHFLAVCWRSQAGLSASPSAIAGKRTRWLRDSQLQASANLLSALQLLVRRMINVAYLDPSEWADAKSLDPKKRQDRDPRSAPEVAAFVEATVGWNNALYGALLIAPPSVATKPRSTGQLRWACFRPDSCTRSFPG